VELKNILAKKLAEHRSELEKKLAKLQELENHFTLEQV